jgi:multidrug resistance efflux pump
MAYEAIKAHIEIEKTLYAKTILRAPFDGVITKRMIELGDVVSGQMLKTAFNIQSQHARILVVELDQKYSSDINIGDTFLYKVDGDDNQYKGEVYRIYPEANSNNRKIALQVIAKDLKVGLFGEGKIITSGDKNNSVKESQE